MLPARRLLRLPSLQGHSFYDRLLTPLVTLWLLLFQRFNPDHTLDAALACARQGGADRFKPRLSHRLRSPSTGPLSDARQRLPLAFVLEVLQLLGDKISRLNPAARWKGWPVVLLDGSTVRLRPYGQIPKHFPPHGNQHASRYWCLMRVAVSFCAFSGAALDCAMGPLGLGEQALGCQLMLRAARSLFIGDRNFGIFLIAQAAGAKGHQVLLRLTDQRAARLLGRKVRRGDQDVRWAAAGPTQLAPGLSAEPIAGRLLVLRLERRGFRSLRLCLFTTLLDRSQYPAQELAELYGRRWHVELDLRYLKTQMDAAQLDVHSAEMARKEWLASLIAYNLIRSAMSCAALHAHASPLALSFSNCRRRLEHWLNDFGAARGRLDLRWKELLEQMARCRLPKRKRPRPTEPRAQRHLRHSFPPLRGSRSTARKLSHKPNFKS